MRGSAVKPVTFLETLFSVAKTRYFAWRLRYTDLFTSWFRDGKSKESFRFCYVQFLTSKNMFNVSKMTDRIASMDMSLNRFTAEPFNCHYTTLICYVILCYVMLCYIIILYYINLLYYIIILYFVVSYYKNIINFLLTSK